jgi:hypothetical protein
VPAGAFPCPRPATATQAAAKTRRANNDRRGDGPNRGRGVAWRGPRSVRVPIMQRKLRSELLLDLAPRHLPSSSAARSVLQAWPDDRSSLFWKGLRASAVLRGATTLLSHPPLQHASHSYRGSATKPEVLLAVPVAEEEEEGGHNRPSAPGRRRLQHKQHAPGDGRIDDCGKSNCCGTGTATAILTRREPSVPGQSPKVKKTRQQHPIFVLGGCGALHTCRPRREQLLFRYRQQASSSSSSSSFGEGGGGRGSSAHRMASSASTEWIRRLLSMLPNLEWIPRFPSCTFNCNFPFPPGPAGAAPPTITNE